MEEQLFDYSYTWHVIVNSKISDFRCSLNPPGVARWAAVCAEQEMQSFRGGHGLDTLDCAGLWRDMWKSY